MTDEKLERDDHQVIEPLPNTDGPSCSKEPSFDTDIKDPVRSIGTSKEPLPGANNRESSLCTTNKEPLCVTKEEPPCSTTVYDITMEDVPNEYHAEGTGITSNGFDGQEEVLNYVEQPLSTIEGVDRPVHNCKEPLRSLGDDHSEELPPGEEESDVSGDLKEFELSRLTSKRQSQEGCERLA